MWLIAEAHITILHAVAHDQYVLRVKVTWARDTIAQRYTYTESLTVQLLQFSNLPLRYLKIYLHLYGSTEIYFSTFTDNISAIYVCFLNENGQ